MKQEKLTEKQQAELTEILEMVKITEQKAREFNEKALAFEVKWKHRLKGREGVKPDSCEIL